MRNGWQRWAIRLTVIGLAVGLATGVVQFIIGVRDHYTEVQAMHGELRALRDSLLHRTP